MPAIKLKITKPGYESFNGFIRSFEFKNGVSVEPIDVRTALRIGAAIPVVDEHGNQVSPLTYRPEQHLANTAAPVLKSLQQQASEPQSPVDLQKSEGSKANETVAENGPEREYTREELEKIADAKGINGLREIGEKLGVKGRAVAELIEKILQAQIDRKATASAPIKLASEVNSAEQPKAEEPKAEEVKVEGVLAGQKTAE